MSVTSADFKRFINGVTSESTSSETSKVDVEPSTTSNDDDMDASSSTSGDGDTVRDNDDLLADTGNTGRVNASLNEGQVTHIPVMSGMM